eukprot:m51a1_g3124 hypothetical protein (572) ;mRNA; f:227547-229522
MRRAAQRVWAHRRALSVAAAAASLAAVSPLAVPGGRASRCLGVAAAMGVLWVTEALPLAATALLPVALLPALGVCPAAVVAAQYFDSVSCVALASLLMAAGVERWGVHVRLSAWAVRLARGRPAALLLGFYACSFFLSMWLSNASATLLLYPNAIASCTRARAAPSVLRASLLAVVWGASLGGAATIVGTATNLVFVRAYSAWDPDAVSLVTFSRWLAYALPVTLVLSVVALAVLYVYAFPPRQLFARRAALLGSEDDDEHAQLHETLPAPPDDDKEAGVSESAQQAASAGSTGSLETQGLPPMSFEEATITLLFFALALLWSLRSDLRFNSFVLPGWGRLLPSVDDGATGIAVALVCFLIPARSSVASAAACAARAARGEGTDEPLAAAAAADAAGAWDTTLLDGRSLRQLPWEMLVLLGGGLALAKAFVLSGLQRWLSTLVPSAASPLSVVLAACLVAVAMTQVLTNVSCAAVLMPVLLAVAQGMALHPLVLMAPVAVCCSLSLATPVASGPNLFVFATGRLRVVDMLVPGGLVCAVGVVVVALLSVSLLPAVFGVWDLASASASGSAL